MASRRRNVRRSTKPLTFDAYQGCFDKYVELMTRQLRDRGYFFNHDRCEAGVPNDQTLIDGKIAFATSVGLLGHNPTVPIGIDVFPSHGPEIRRVDNNEHYAALVTNLLWYYRIDESKGPNQMVEPVIELYKAAVRVDGSEILQAVRMPDKDQAAGRAARASRQGAAGHRTGQPASNRTATGTQAECASAALPGSGRNARRAGYVPADLAQIGVARNTTHIDPERET